MSRAVAKAIETFETRTLLTAFTWNGTTSTAWNTSANWTQGGGDADGIPDADDDVTINSAANNPVLSQNESIGSLAGTNGAVNLSTFTLTIGTTTSPSTYGGTFSGSGGITKTGAGRLDLTGNSTYSGETTLNQGTLATGTLSSNLGDGSSTNSVVFNGGTLEMAGVTSPATRKFILLADGTISDGSANATINGVISGDHNLIKTGNGNLTLGGVNTFGGTSRTLDIRGGTLRFAADTALGDSTNSVTFSNSAVALTATSSLTTARQISLTSPAILDALNSAVFTANGQITSSAAFTLGIQSSGTGAGVVVLGNGTNSYTGTTNVTSGTLRVTANGALGASSGGVSLAAATTTLDLQNVLYTTAEALTINAGTLTVSSGTSSYAGAVTIATACKIDVDGTQLSLDGVVSGNQFTSTGAGILALNNAANTFTGASSINAGTLLVNGATQATATFSIASGATIGGTGTVSGSVTVASGGHLAPGTSPGQTTISALTLASGSNYDVEIGGTTAGSEYDQTIVTTSVSLNGAILNTTAFGGFTPSGGQIYRIIDNQSGGAVTGTFSGLAEGALISNFLGSGYAAVISYLGGTGNDVIITTNSAPVLDATQSPTLTDVAYDDFNSAGNTVASIVVNGSITDVDTVVDPESIAVVAADNTNGQWQYSTNGGGSWSNLSPSTAAARLLLPTHLIRFVPTAGFEGSATFTFRAWDQTVGTAGATADTTTTGGMSPFSSASDTASVYVGSATTDVNLDIDGNLIVTDIGPSTNDTLIVQSDVTNSNIIITDPNHRMQATVGTLSADGHSVTVPFATITGIELGFDMLAGTDSLTVDFSLGDFGYNIIYAGGDPIVAPGDVLTVTGAKFGGGKFTTVTHTTDSADISAGTIDVTGNGAGGSFISYLGLEPVTDNLDPINRVFSFTGGTETITVTDTGGADGKMQIASTLGEAVTFVNPSGSLTINGGTGDDTVTITSVDSAFTAALAVSGDGGADTINSNAALTLGSGTSTGAVSLDAETISVTQAINTTAVTTGTISLTGTAVSLGANLSSDSADITIVGSSTVTLTTSVTIDSESGNNGNAGAISFSGTGQIQPDGTKGRDLTVNAATTFVGGTGGAVTLASFGSNGGTFLNDISVSTLATTNGVIMVGGNITTDDNGAAVPGTITLAGDVRLNGSRTLSTAQSDTNGGAIDLSNATVSATGSGFDLTLLTESTFAGGTGGNITLGTFSNAGGSFVDDLNVDADTATTTGGTVTFNNTATLAGSFTTAAFDILLPNSTSDLTVSGAKTVDFTAERTIHLSLGSSITGATGAFTLSANQQATATTGDFTGVLVVSATISNTTGGITLLGKGGTGASENDGVRITDDTTGGIGTLSKVSTTTGSIIITGVADSGTAGDDGVHIEDATVSGTGAAVITITGTGSSSSSSEGVYLAGKTSAVSSAGGNIGITGTTSGDDGVEISEADVTNTSTGKITISGTGGSTGTTSEGVLLAGNSSTSITVVSGALAITGTGGNDDGIDISGSTLATSGSGSVTLTGTGGTAANADGIVVTGTGNQINSTSSGNITLNGTATNGDGVEFASTLTQAVNSTAGGKITITGDGAGAGNVGAQIDAPVTSNTGAISITSADDVTFAATGDVTSTSGNVTVTGDNAAGNNGGVVTQADGALINAGSGSITVTTDGNITLGGLQTTGALVTVTTTSGEILDGGDTHVEIVANSGTASLTAKNGIGATAGSGATAAIETMVAGLTASTTNTNIVITESDTISTLNLNSGTGDITLVAIGQVSDLDGTVDVTGDEVSLQVTGAGATLGTAGGSIQIVAATSLVTATNNADQYLATTTSITIGAADLNSGTGIVHITAGTFFTTATGSVAGHLEVGSGAAISGIGSVTGSASVLSGGSITPGNSQPGIITTGALTLNAGGTFNLEIGGNTPGNTAGNHDQIVTTGDVTLTGSTLNYSSFGGYVPLVGDSYEIIDNGGAGPVTGTFSGLAQNAVIPNFLGSGLYARIRYNAGDGNDVVIDMLQAETHVSIVGGDLVITDINGGTSTDALTISVSGTDYVINDPNLIISTNIVGATGDGTNTITVPIALVTGSQIQFATLVGADAISVDLNGTFSDDIVITAGDPATAPGDTLTLTNGTFTTVTHAATGVGAGTVTLSGATNTITYSEIEAVTDSLTVSNRVFNHSNSAQTIDVTDTTAANGRTNITSTVGTPIDFTNPSVSFTLNGGTNNDTINLTAVDSGFVASVAIDGGAGTDSLTSTAALTLGSGSSVATVSMNAETLTINGAIDTTAGATETIALTGTTITINAGLTTDIGNVNITSEDDVNFSAAGDIVTGTGSVTVIADNAVGNNGGAITQVNGSLINVGTGTITLTADGHVTLGGLQTTNATASAVMITSTSGEVLDGGDTHQDIAAALGTVTITAAQGIGASAGSGTTPAIEITTDKLVATTTNTNIDIVENDALSAISLNAGTGDVSLVAGAAITDTDAATDVVGDDITLSIDGIGPIGGAANPIAVDGTTLSTSTTMGDQFLSNPDSIFVGNNGIEASAGVDTVHLASGTFLTTSTGGDILGLVEVQSGATLGGTGSVSDTVSILSGGTIAPGFLAPGITPGILNVDAIAFSAGSAFNVQFGGTTAGNAANNHDQLATIGDVALNNATLNLSAVNGFVPADGQSYTIINNGSANPVSGTFNGLPQDAVIANFLGTTLFARIRYNQGTGNDVVIDAFTVETSVELSGTTLVITDVNGGTSNDDLTITLDGLGNFIISDSSLTIGSSIGGATGSGTTSVTVPVGTITSIQFVTLAGDDAVTVDLTGGNISQPISVAGGIGTDTLTVQDGTFTTITHTATGVGAGTIAFTPATEGTVTYSGLEAVTDSLTVADRAFQFSNTAQTISITDAAAANGRTNITSTAGTPIDFTNPTNSFFLEGGTNNDTINFTAADSGFVSSIDTDLGAGTDSITVDAVLTLGTGNAGTVTLDAETVTVNAAINTTAGTTETISVTGGILTVNAGLTTDSGNVTVSGSGAVSFAAAGDVTSTSGAISVASSGSTITQTDGSLLDAGSGKITVSANGNVLLGGLATTSNAADAVTVTSTAGEIIDNGDTHLEIVAPNGTATLSAANGIGATLGTGGTAAIEMTIDKLVATTTNSNIDIFQTQGLNAIDVNAGSGDVSLYVSGNLFDSTGDPDITGDNIFINVPAPVTTIGSAGNPISVSGTTLETLTNGTDQYLATPTSITIGVGDLDAGGAPAIVHLTSGTFITTLGSGDINANAEIGSGATLAGNGDVTGSVSVLSGGTVAPGVTNIGILSTGDVSFANGSSFNVQIGGNAPGNTASDHDQLVVTGTVTINTATLNYAAFNSYMPQNGDAYTIIDNDGADPVVGNFAGLPQDTIITDFLGSGLFAVVLYDAGDGNDVVLSIYAAETEVKIDSGNLVITDINGGTSDDDLTITLNGAGTDYIISDPTNIITTSIAGSTGNGTNTVTVPLTALGAAGNIQFNTLAGNDSVTIDYTTGVFTDETVVTGGAETVADSLTLLGATHSTVTYTETGVGAGTIAFSGPANATVTYSQLETIADALTVQNRVFNFDGGAETITVTDPVAMDASTTISSTAGTPVNFVIPSVSLTVNAGAGDDTINLTAIEGTFAASITVDGGAGTDSYTSTPALTLGSGTSDGTYTVDAETITINGSINTTAGSVETITLTGSTITVNAGLTTDSGSVSITSEDDVTFAAAGDITSTSGNVTVIADNAVGNNGGVITQADGSLVNAGSGTISFSADGDITLGGLLTTRVATNAIEVVSTSGGIVDGGDAHVDVSAVNGTATINGVTGVGTANAIETTNASLVASSLNADINIIETDDLSGILINAGTGDVSLQAGGAISDSDGSTDITGDAVVITITAAGAALGTAAKSIALAADTLATSTNGADQYLSEMDSVTIDNADLNAGGAPNVVHLTSGTFVTTAAGGNIIADVDVANGATLSGTGTATGDVSAASGSAIRPGFASPGVEPGILNVGDAATLEAGSTLYIQFAGDAPGNTATDHDQFATTGDVTINGATLDLSAIGAFVPTNGVTYVIVNNGSANPVSGTFAGLPQNTIIPNFLGAVGFYGRIRYNGGTGNDVVIDSLVAETSVTLDGLGNLVITDINGGVSNDELAISINGAGTHYIINDPNLIIATNIAGAVGDGTNTVTVPISAVTGNEIQFNTLAGTDEITIGLANGNFTKDIVVTAGTPGTSPGDSLVLTDGGTFTNATHTMTGVGAGTYSLTGNNLVTYSGIEYITDEHAVQNRSFQTTGANETVSITDPVAMDSSTTIQSTDGTEINFVNPTVSVSLDTGNGDDTINLTAIDGNFKASMTIAGAAGTDTLTSNASLTLGSGTSTGVVDFSAETIAINNPIETTAVGTGTITLDGNAVTIANALTTGNANITIDGDTSVALSTAAAVINAGTADIQITTLATGSVTSGGAAIELIGDDIVINSGSVGASGNPITMNANTLASTGGNNSDQYLSEADTVTIAANDLNSGTGSVHLVSGTFITTATGSIIGTTEVESGATLAGTGTTAAVNVNNGGTINPGAPTTGVGTINTGNLDLDAGSTFVANATLPSGGNYDSIAVTGTVDVTGATLSLQVTAGFGAPYGAWLLINNDGVDPVVGEFAGLPELSLITLDGRQYYISYVGGTGNDVLLSIPILDVYVDDDWAGLPFGTDPDGAGPAIGIGIDAFPTIQEGVNTVFPGGEVHVYAGPYPENVVINKDVTVTGENGHTTGGEPDVIAIDANGGIGIDINGGDVNLTNLDIDDSTIGIDASGSGHMEFCDIVSTNATTTGIQSTTTGNVTICGGTYDGIDVTGADNIYLVTPGDVISTDDVVLTANNDIEIDTNLNAGDDTVTIVANGDGAGTEGFDNCDGAIITTNDTAAAISITVNTLMGGTGVAEIGVLTAGTTAGSSGGRVTVAANMGAVLDCNLALNNITAGNTVLSGLAGVGTSIDPIETTVSRLEGLGGTGGFFDVNSTSLTIGGISGLTTGVSSSTGNIDVRADGVVTVAENVVSTGATGNIFIKANENTGLGRDLTVNAGVTISSPNGNINLEAGDNITTLATSVISAPAGAVVIRGDCNDNDTEGTAIDIASQLVSGTGTSVIGGNDNDTYEIAYPLGVSNSGTVTITDNGGTDAATVCGTTGDDLLFFTSNNSFPAGQNTTTDLVTRGTTSGEPIVIPNTIEAFQLCGDTGNDTFTVQPSTFFPLVVNGNAPVFGDPTVPPGDQLLLDTFNNDFTLVGKTIQVSGSLNGQSFQPITPISIENLPLLPASPTPAQRYDFNSRSVVGGVYVQSPTQPGWTGVTADAVYTNALGYGWSEVMTAFRGTTDTTVDGSLVNDGHMYTTGVQNDVPTFRANVGNGWISVTVDYGHPTKLMDGLRIVNADTGTYLAQNLSTLAGQTDHQTFFLRITDGSLNLRFEDVLNNRMIAINGIDIRPAALFTMGFSDLPAGPVQADGSTDTFHLGSGPANLLVTLEASLGTIVGTDADPYIEGFQVLTDASGAATVMIKRPTGAGTSTILMTTPTGEEWGCQSIDYALLSGRNFDFNTNGSPTQATYQPVSPVSPYSTANGYGWTQSPLPTSQTNGTLFTGTLANASNDYQRSTTPNNFRVDLPNGTYEIHLSMGDGADHAGIDIAANGTTLVTDLSLPRNTITEKSFTVTVTNGQLNLSFNPGDSTIADPAWIINALRIRPTSLVGQITPVNEGTVPADGTTISTIDATSTLAPGTLVTVSSTMGTITSVDADPLTVGIQVVVGAGGNISFNLKSPYKAGTPTVEWRTLDGSVHTTVTNATFLNFALPSLRRYDFGAGFSDATMTNVATGFIGTRTNHNPNIDGFGWTDGVSGRYFAPSTPPVTTTDFYVDGHTGTGDTPGIFKVQANAGTMYDVRVYVGHYCHEYSDIKITVEGTAAQFVSTSAPSNLFANVTALGARDLDGDGFISVRFESPLADHHGNIIAHHQRGWTVNGLDIATSAAGLPPAVPLVGTVYSTNTSEPTLTAAALAPIAAIAKSYYTQQPGLTAAQLNALQTVQISIADLSTAISGPATLGLSSDRAIVLDDNGAGLGWDITPESVEANRYDLLSVLIHELGHVLGHNHSAGGVMSESLQPGLRPSDIDNVFTNW